MRDGLMFGFKRHLVTIPAAVWRRVLPRVARHEAKGRLAKFDSEHHRVRDFAVTEIARTGQPVSPATIAETLDIPRARVDALLDELERQMVFLYREGGEDVVWAYPVTAAETPHRLTFPNGAQCNAA